MLVGGQLAPQWARSSMDMQGALADDLEAEGNQVRAVVDKGIDKKIQAEAKKDPEPRTRTVAFP